MVGERFGSLVINSIAPKRKSRIYFDCTCDCGASHSAYKANLLSGRVSSCGCAKGALVSKAVVVDLVGRRFGKLVVIDRAGTRRGFVLWNCSCDCGSKSVVTSGDLLHCGTKSCGCAWLEKHTEAVVGKRFGLLVAICRVVGDLGKWICECDCGNRKKLATSRFTTGATVSCGCAHGNRRKNPLRSDSVRSRAAAQSHKRRARILAAEGEFTAEQIEDLYRKQRGWCACCKVKKLGRKFHRDHKIPLTLGGSNDILNIELLCAKCNLEKGKMDPIDWANKRGMLC